MVVMIDDLITYLIISLWYICNIEQKVIRIVSEENYNKKLKWKSTVTSTRTNPNSVFNANSSLVLLKNITCVPNVSSNIYQLSIVIMKNNAAKRTVPKNYFLMRTRNSRPSLPSLKKIKRYSL